MDIKEQKAKKYAEKAYPYTEDMRFQCETHFEAGWNEALKNQWIRVEDRLPEFNERVLTLHITYDDITTVRIMRRIKIFLNPDEFIWRWSLTGDKYGIIAWMPIPSFDKILEDNKDVLKRLKNK